MDPPAVIVIEAMTVGWALRAERWTARDPGNKLGGPSARAGLLQRTFPKSPVRQASLASSAGEIPALEGLATHQESSLGGLAVT